MLLVPCNYLHNYMGYEGDSIPDECIWDRDVQTDYIGPLDFKVLFNYKEFNQLGF